jgi:hypothetical protein
MIPCACPSLSQIATGSPAFGQTRTQVLYAPSSSSMRTWANGASDVAASPKQHIVAESSDFSSGLIRQDERRQARAVFIFGCVERIESQPIRSPTRFTLYAFATSTITNRRKKPARKPATLAAITVGASAALKVTARLEALLQYQVYLPIHRNIVGAVIMKLKLSYGLGKKMIPKLVEMV